jgi:hypothetical protein
MAEWLALRLSRVQYFNAQDGALCTSGGTSNITKQETALNSSKSIKTKLYKRKVVGKTLTCRLEYNVQNSSGGL